MKEQSSTEAVDFSINETMGLANEKFNSYGPFLGMKFRNADEENAFYQFSASRILIRTVSLISVLMGLFGVYFYTLSLLHAKSWIVLVATLLVTVLIRYPLFFILWCMKRSQKRGHMNNFLQSFLPHVSVMENLLAICSSFSVGVALIARALNGKCESLYQTHMWGCNSELASRALPQEHLVLLMLIPIIYSVVYKAIKWEYVCLTWTMVVTCVSISIYIANATQSINTLIIYAPMSLIILYENHRQNLILFFVTQKQQRLLDENRILSENAQNELRHMIANVAHDLKTPLAAFMNGVEVIAAQVDDLKKGYELWEKQTENTVFVTANDIRDDGTTNATGTKEDNIFFEVMGSLNDNIKNLYNVNNFMTMTINRCIDYTKASKGLKLEARLETVNLQEIIALPVNCMRDLQTRIAIVLNPFASDIATHIITDKQWLQENLFCLISNAVKYSSNGNVSISISLTDTDNPLLHVAQVEDPTQQEQHHQSESSGTPVRGSVANEESQRSSLRTVSNRSRNMYSHMDKFTIGKSALIIEQEEESNKQSGKEQVAGTSAAHPSRDNLMINAAASISSGEESLITSLKSDFLKPISRFGNGAKVHVLNTPQPLTLERQHSSEEILLFEVEDTGIGLSEEVMAKLFTPFKQAQRRAGGTGLGLYSLAKRLQALGGYYGVCDRRDGQQGSLFWFAIPYKADTNILSILSSNMTSMNELVPKERDPVLSSSFTTSNTTSVRNDHEPASSATVLSTTAVTAAAALVSPRAAGDGKLNILVVDDSVSILKMTSMMLKRQGHIITQAENGAEALNRIDEARAAAALRGDDTAHCPFDVVLMDLNMPVMDGLEATTRLRSTEAAMSTDQSVGSSRTGSRTQQQDFHQFVVGFSANSDHATMMEAYAAGVDDFICKPFALQTFNDTVQRYQLKQGHVVAV